MTREEAKGRFNWMKRVLGNDPTLVAFNERSLEKHIDRIYDDFKSQNCENCKYTYFCDIDGNVCNNQESKLFAAKVDDTVYCKEFEPKENK